MSETLADLYIKLKSLFWYLVDIITFRWMWWPEHSVEKNSTKSLFLLFSSIGFYFTLIFFYPFKLIFSGEWELNQKIVLGDVTGFGAIELRFYAVTMLLGVIAGYLLCLKLAKIRGLADTVVDRLFVGLVVFGLIGARFFYVIFNFEDFSDSFLSIFEIYKGGLAVFGMILAGVGYMVWYCSRYKFNFWLFADFVAPGVLLGQIIGRFGNFFNYESYGTPTKVWWGMHVPDSANLEFLTSRYFHPTFLYEIIPNFILFLFILRNYKKLTQKHAGLILGIYLIGYGVIRSFVEPFRIDPLVISLPDPIKINLDFITKNTFNFEIVDIRMSSVAAFVAFVIGVLIYNRRSKIYVKYQTVTEIKYK
jgi:phosphatidylglycerol:prolipoprotein diacylglycerol transferase